MDKPYIEHRLSTVCLELTLLGSSGAVEAIWSIPGRDGTLCTLWRAMAGPRLSTQQWEDLRTHVLDTLDSWYLTAVGSQESFLLEGGD